MFWQLLKKQSDQEKKIQLIQGFLLQTEHQWILRDRALKSRIIDFFSRIDSNDLNSLIKKKKLLLLISDGRYSCTLKKEWNSEIVLVYPDLLRLFQSAEYLQAQAILAHEIGHILLRHNEKRMSIREAQLEADRFAAQLGYAEELAKALSFFPNSRDIQERISNLIKFL
jgi:Zn-dependent protease with chaperone function